MVCSYYWLSKLLFLQEGSLYYISNWQINNLLLFCTFRLHEEYLKLFWITLKCCAIQCSELGSTSIFPTPYQFFTRAFSRENHPMKSQHPQRRGVLYLYWNKGRKSTGAHTLFSLQVPAGTASFYPNSWLHAAPFLSPLSEVHKRCRAFLNHLPRISPLNLSLHPKVQKFKLVQSHLPVSRVRLAGLCNAPAALKLEETLRSISKTPILSPIALLAMTSAHIFPLTWSLNTQTHLVFAQYMTTTYMSKSSKNLQQRVEVTPNSHSILTKKTLWLTTQIFLPVDSLVSQHQNQLYVLPSKKKSREQQQIIDFSSRKMPIIISQSESRHTQISFFLIKQAKRTPLLQMPHALSLAFLFLLTAT